jgi:hypothetical protein
VRRAAERAGRVSRLTPRRRWSAASISAGAVVPLCGDGRAGARPQYVEPGGEAGDGRLEVVGRPAPASSVSGASTQNSSPPTRATVS